MIACNIAAHQVDVYLDTGFLYPVVVPPCNRHLFNAPLGVWCIGDDKLPKDTRLGYGGQVEWRKVSANPDNWLYVAKAELNMLFDQKNELGRDPVAELNAELAKSGMRFENAVAMGGTRECAMDNCRTDEIWHACMLGMVEQIKQVWLKPQFHQSIRLQQKMVANKQMTAQDFWTMAGPTMKHPEDCACHEDTVSA